MKTTEGNNLMSDGIFEKKLIFFLRSTGRLTPITPEQVDAFEKNHPIPKMKKTTDPMEIIKRGYQPYHPQVTTAVNEPETDYYRAAARNGVELDADTLRKMRDDRKRDGIE